MADFAQLGEAMNRAMGGKAGEFLTLYTNHRRDAIRRTVDSNPVSVACMEFIDQGRSYLVSGRKSLFSKKVGMPGLPGGADPRRTFPEPLR